MAKSNARTIVIINQKGGVAKTTTAVNLAADLGDTRRVLLVDFDPQRSATSSIFGNVTFEFSCFDLLFEHATPKEVIQPSADFGVDVIPSDIMLSSAELRLASMMGRERFLARCLARVKSYYDICIIDTPPALGLLSINALVAADEVLIPVCPDYFSLKGVKLLEDTIESVRRNLCARLSLLGVLMTRYKKRIITDSACDAIAAYFGPKLFKTTIPDNIRIEEAHNAHLPLRKYDARCKAAVAYRELAKEIARCPTMTQHRT